MIRQAIVFVRCKLVYIRAMTLQSVYASYFGNLAQEASIDIIKLSDTIERFVLDVEAGKIANKDAFTIVAELTEWQNTSQIGANLARVGDCLDGICLSINHLDDDSEGYYYRPYSEALGELLRVLYNLRQSGWAPTLPVLKLYFHQHDKNGKTISSATTTLYFDKGRIGWFDGQAGIMKKLKVLVKECQSLEQLGELADMHKFGNYKLVEQDFKILLYEEVF